MDERTCSLCNNTLPLSEFAIIGGTTWVRTKCKKCIKENKDHIKNLKKQYPVPTSEDYRCPICGITKQDMRDMGFRYACWFLDHDHFTHMFRGYVCGRCNTGLSSFKDNTEVLEKAIGYLRGHYEAR